MSRPRTVAWLSLAAMGIGALTALATILSQHWEQVVQSAEGLRVTWLLAAATVLLATFGLLFLAWWRILGALGSTLPVRPALLAYVASQLPKYVPGRVAGHGVRMMTAARYGVPASLALSSVALEGMLSIGVGACFALLLALPGSSAIADLHSLWLLALLLGGAIGTVILLPKLTSVGWLEKVGLRELRRNRLQLRTISAIYVVSWALIGAAHWCVANAVAPLGARYLVPVTGAIAASACLGQLAIFTPAGLGVREGALYLFAQTWLGPAGALLFVALSRILSVVIEVLMTLAATIYWSRTRLRTADAASNEAIP